MSLPAGGQAGHRYRCLVDANVLYSRVLRDYVLYAAQAKLITVTWSETILDEMCRHLIANRAGFTTESARRLVQAMNTAFRYACQVPDDTHVARLCGFVLPDEGDRHVIGAALAGDAQIICTHNVKDFPADVMGALGLQVVRPDELLCGLIRTHPSVMMQVHATSVASLPGATDQSTLDALVKAGTPNVAGLMKDLLHHDPSDVRLSPARRHMPPGAAGGRLAPAPPSL